GLPIPALTLTLLLKRAPRQPREIDRPPTLVGLGWAKHQADSRLPLQRVPHGQPSCDEIDVLPLQPQRLPDPQAAGSKQHPERVPPTAVRETKQLLKLGAGQGGHLAPHRTRGTDSSVGLRAVRPQCIAWSNARCRTACVFSTVRFENPISSSEA